MQLDWIYIQGQERFQKWYDTWLLVVAPLEVLEKFWVGGDGGPFNYSVTSSPVLEFGL